MLKLALPLVVGIIIGWLCDVGMLHIATLSVVAVLLLAGGLFTMAPRWLFGVGAVGAMLAVGLFAVTCDKSENLPEWPDEKGVFEAQLMEVPYMDGGATRALARVVRADSSNVAGARSEGVVQLYFANCVEVETLRVGDKVCFKGQVKNPLNRGNPAEFDAVRYMRVKGVCGSAFLPVGSWSYGGAGEKDFSMLALELRDKIVRLYEKMGFSGDNLALLTAFSVGERRGFPQELREVYASAGVSHLLALSGLHLGIFYMVLVALFSSVGCLRRLFVVRELLALLLLWGFAFVAGLTPSVVRAAVLFTLVGVGRCLRRDGSALNSLAFAAVVMLIFSPRLLFDVSFQLSFAAVATLLLFLPWVRGVLRCDAYGRVYGAVASLVAVSLVAQVGTLPFVWYYFGTFPVYFLLANLLLVPLATLLMLLVVLLWVTTVFPFVYQPVVWALECLLSFMNGVAGFVSELPGASFALPQVGVVGALLAGLLLLLLSLALVCRRWWGALMVAVMAVAVLLLNIFAFEREEKEDYMLLFNNRKMAAVLAVARDGKSYVTSSVPEFDADCDGVVAPYIKREQLAEPVWVADGYSDSLLSCSNGLLSFGGVRLQVLADDCWLADSVQRPVDALLLCRGFLGAVDELLLHYPASCVLLDGSLYEGSRRRLLRECAKAGIGCIDISQKGAVKLVGGDDSFSLTFMRGK